MISVIVPIYNVEEYLRRCVDSLLQQTYADLEVILVDDGSPDGCGAICDAYASQEPRVRAVHKPNGGLSDARNAGLLVAAGDEIAFVDSDDWVAPDFLAAMHDALTRTGADIVECSVVKTAGDAAGGAAFGGTAIAPEVPCGPEDTARAIEEAGPKKGKQRWKEELVAAAASRSCVRTRKPLSERELTAILMELAACKMPYATPGGRPTMIFTSKNDLDRRFGRS